VSEFIFWMFASSGTLSMARALSSAICFFLCFSSLGLLEAQMPSRPTLQKRTNQSLMDQFDNVEFVGIRKDTEINGYIVYIYSAAEYRAIAVTMIKETRQIKDWEQLGNISRVPADFTVKYGYNDESDIRDPRSILGDDALNPAPSPDEDEDAPMYRISGGIEFGHLVAIGTDFIEVSQGGNRPSKILIPLSKITRIVRPVKRPEATGHASNQSTRNLPSR
jgi:hypothetical protein